MIQTTFDLGRWRLVDHFGSVYELEDIEVTDSALFGICLQARYRLEGKRWEQGRGSFRIDTTRSLEPVHEQMEMAA